MENSAGKVFKGCLERELTYRILSRKTIPLYRGDNFLSPPVSDLHCGKKLGFMQEEHCRQGVYSIDTKTVSSITSHPPGYLIVTWNDRRPAD